MLNFSRCDRTLTLEILLIFFIFDRDKLIMRYQLFFILLPLFGYGQVASSGNATDQNGNSFEWINYGTQDWAIENAEIVTYRDGTPIPEVTDDDEWFSLTTGAWCYYDNDSSNSRLYNAYAIIGKHDDDPNTPNKEFAPEGWHVPSDAEWTTLENHLIANGYNYDGTTSGNKIAKAMSSITGWNSSTELGAIGNDQSLNNSSGFNAFPEGCRVGGVSETDGFFFKGSIAFFWSSTEDGADNVSRRLFNSYSDLFRYNYNKQYGFSVRFVRD